MPIDLGFIQSPNYNKGRGNWNKKADIIVHHVCEGYFTGSISWLCNPASGASSTFVTSQKGEFKQLVKLEDTAWANGNKLSWIDQALNETVISRPYDNANSYTFSIENEGFSYKDNYGVPTIAQLDAIIECHKKIVDYILTYNPNWRASRENIIGHCDIVYQRKPSCPSPNCGKYFPWDIIIERTNDYIDSLKPAVIINNIQKEEEEEMRYNNIDEIARDMPWAVETISFVIEKKIIADPKALDLTRDMIRMIMFNHRAGLYNNL